MCCVREETALTVDGDAGLWSVILAGHLPDVEGLGGRVGQQAEHEDDGVGVRKAVRMDVSGSNKSRGGRSQSGWTRYSSGPDGSTGLVTIVTNFYHRTKTHHQVVDL